MPGAMTSLLFCLSLLAYAVNVTAQKIPCTTIEGYLGQDKDVLVGKLEKSGYGVNGELQYLSQEVAGKIKKFTRKTCSGLTLKKKNDNHLVFIIYDQSGRCISFSQGFPNTENKDFISSEKEVLKTGYTATRVDIANIKPGERRIYKKGNKRFLLLHNEPKGGYSVTCFMIEE